MANLAGSTVSASDELVASLDLLERCLLGDYSPEAVDVIADRIENDLPDEAVMSQFSSAL